MIPHICLTLIALVSWSAHAEKASPRLRSLIPCQAYFRAESSETPEFTRRIFDRYAEFKVTDLGKFRGHVLSRAGSRGNRTVPMPDLMHTSSKWRIEEWTTSGRTYHFYDVGSRNLESDAADLHAALIALLQDNPSETLLFEASDARRRDLENLQRFQTAFARATRDTLGRTLDGPAVRDRSPLARTLLSNSDLFGILDRRLDPGANRRTIERHLAAAIKITYDQEQNFVRPNYIGLMNELGLAVPRELRLPVMNRIRPEKLERFRTELKAHLGESADVCEIAPMHVVEPNLPKVVKHRLLYEVFNQARRRGCTTMIASLTDRVAPFFVRHGFTAWRGTPNQSGSRETVYLLQVNSPEFNAVLHDLHVRIDGEVDA